MKNTPSLISLARNARRMLAVALLALVSLAASAQDDLFDRYANTQGVTTVCVSKAMLSLMPQVKAGGVDIAAIAQKLESVQILSCDRPSLIPGIRQTANSIYSRDGYEEVMRMNEGGQTTLIYQKQLSGGMNEFALVTGETNELNIVNVKGHITLRDIQSIAQ